MPINLKNKKKNIVFVLQTFKYFVRPHWVINNIDFNQ